MRALLIVNPNATSTTSSRRDLIVRALRSALDLDVVQTRYRGDATRLAAAAAAEKFGLVITLGGDGTVNEAVNGLLSGGTRLMAPGPHAGGQTADARGAADLPLEAPDLRPDAADLPALAALPGGNANVFVRSLSLPDDPVDAAARLIEDLAAGQERLIGLGWANGRYFTFNAGLGLDAEVVRAVDGMRAHGSAVTPALFARAALRQYFQVTDRRRPAIRLRTPSELCADSLFLCIVSNSSPWTYLGRRPVHASPDASFDSGLDLLAFRSLGTLATLLALRQMLADGARQPRGRGLFSAHDLPALTLTADRPLAFQLDGEYVGEAEAVSFRSVPHALRVVGLGHQGHSDGHSHTHNARVVLSRAPHACQLCD